MFGVSKIPLPFICGMIGSAICSKWPTSCDSEGERHQGFRFDVINVISKPEFYEDDYEGDGRRFYTDGRNVHKYLKELVAAGGIDGMITGGRCPPPRWKTASATPLRATTS